MNDLQDLYNYSELHESFSKLKISVIRYNSKKLVIILLRRYNITKQLDMPAVFKRHLPFGFKLG
jgi:hypothetical protein